RPAAWLPRHASWADRTVYPHAPLPRAGARAVDRNLARPACAALIPGLVRVCTMKRILSGIQPTGSLHLGNYFGMMKPSIALQDIGECYYFIADYHALTSVHDPQILREHVRNVALDFLACGLDPARSCFFRQSDVPEVTELTWILGPVTPM